MANEFTMTKATISDTVKTLEQKQLITKETERLDTRSYSIKLTARGKEIAEKTSLFSKEISTPIDKLYPNDKENLYLCLLDIIRHLNREGIITIQRMCATCSHYEYSGESQQHFCTLLNQNLLPADLRIDCPEHSIKQY